MDDLPTIHSESHSDEILLEGLRFYGYHGVNPEERILGQRFIVDVAMAVDLRRAGQSDDLAETVSYSEVYRLVKGIVEGTPRNLIEAVAEEIADVILARHERVWRVTVTVHKPEVPVKGALLDAAAVRITRWRDQEDDGS